MNIGGLIGGLIAGAIGAALWAALAYYGEIEIAYLALGIGAAVGFGVSLGSRNGGFVPAIVAVLITAGSLVGGKYLAVQLAVHDIDQTIHDQFNIDDDTLLSNFAYDVAEEKIADGKRLKFRNRKKSLDATDGIKDLPKSVVAEAQKRLDALSPEEHDELLAEKKAEFEMLIDAFESNISREGFADSFSGFDILFFLLGMFAAFRIALSDPIEG